MSTLKNTDELIPASAKLAAIIESSGDAIISKDLMGTITSWNKGAEAIFGYSADEAVGRPVTMLFPDDRTDEEPVILARIRRGENIDHYETIRRRKDGTLIDISLSVSPIYNDQGMVVGASKIARDVTERRRSEAELRKLAAIVESSSDAIITKDLDGIVTSWNKGAEEIFGYTADEVIGRPVTILMPENRLDEEPRILERIRNGENVEHYETIRRRKDGTLLDISLNVSPIYDNHGHIIGASKIARDMTIKRRTEAAIRESEIMHKLVQAQEAERHRIARDLHDHLGQQMTALRLRIESLVEKTRGSDTLKEEIEGIQNIALQIDRDIGFLSWELRPTELDELGLKDAMASFVREWSGQYGIAAEFQANLSMKPGERLARAIESNLYRIAQESLNNILKHAKAQNVNVMLHQHNDQILLSVEDDGEGFLYPPKPSNDGKLSGFGLVGMRERAALLNGSLEVESHRGKGTTILVRVPLN